MKNINLFINESSFGSHHKVDSCFQSDILSFTFLPLISNDLYEKEQFYKMFQTKRTFYKFNNTSIDIEDIKSFFLTYKNNLFFLGFDNDREGNAMAKILQLYLISIGIEKENIIRVPLTEKGYIYLSDFMPIKQLKEYVKDRLEELDILRNTQNFKKGGISRRLMLLNNEILTFKDEVENINKNGTSSFTYIVKKALKEK